MEDKCARCDLYRKGEEDRKTDNETDHKTMWGAIGKKLDKWVLIVLIPAAVTGFWYFGNKVDKVGETHTASMDKLSTTVNAMAIQMAGVVVKIDRLEKTHEAGK